MPTQINNVETASNFTLQRWRDFSQYCSFLFNVIWKTAAITVPMATRNILNQNENANSSRAGSPMIMKMPVPSKTQSAPDSHGPKRSRRFKQRLIPSCPSENAQINHEDRCQNDTDSNDMNGLNRRDNPFVGLNRQTKRGLRKPLGKVNHRCFLSNRGLTPAITVFLIKMQCRRGLCCPHRVAMFTGSGDLHLAVLIHGALRDRSDP